MSGAGDAGATDAASSKEVAMTDQVSQGKPVRSASSYVVAGIAGLLGAVGMKVIDILVDPPALRIGTVDIEGIVVDEMRYLQDADFTEERAEAYAQILGPIIDASIEELSVEEGVVLLVGPAVVAGAPNYTEQIQERLRAETKAFRRP